MKENERILNQHKYKIWQGQDNKWYTYLPYDDGRKKKKKNSKEEIENLIIEYYKNKNRNSPLFKNRYDIWVQRQIDCGVSNNTINKYKSDYIRFFKSSEIEQMDISEITSDLLCGFMVKRIKEKKLPYKAAKAMFSMLNGIFSKSQKDRIIQENPCDYIDFPTLRKHCKTQEIKSSQERTVSDEEMKCLYDSIKRDHIIKPNYIPTYAVELATLTGMRVGELAGLTWENVNLAERYILVNKSEKYDRERKRYFIDNTKTLKPRFIPITEEIEVLLKKVKKVETQYGYLCDYVFANNNGRVHARTISDCMRNKCIQAGIPIKSIHALRRTFNSKLRCDGVSSTVASSILGHTEKVNNENYTYDISGNEYKISVMSNVNKEIINAVK